jgi:mannose-6-phosphate isomerase-like protein (cupin superfamily)
MAGQSGRIVQSVMHILFILAVAATAPHPAPIDRLTGEHYIWGKVNDGWHLVKRDEMSIITEQIAPGASEERHYHVRARQFFYVLSGELTMEVGGTSHVLRAGQGIEIPPGVAHQAQNRSAEPVDIIVNSTPKSHGDRVAAPLS